MLESKKKLVIKKTNLLLTRPKEDSVRLSMLFDESEFNFYIAPLIQIKQKSYNYDENCKFDYILFTSKNGLSNFNNLKESDKIIVIGDGTYLLAKKMGMKKVINVKGNTLDLKKKIKLLLKKGQSILHPTEVSLNLDLKNFFINHEFYYNHIGCYISKMKNSDPEIFENFFNSCEDGLITLFSRRTAISFKNEILKLNLLEKCKKKKFLVLSKVIENELLSAGLKNILITKEPNEKSMVDLIIKTSQ